MNPVDHAHQLIGLGGSVHLIGAGGIGMAGVTYLLKARGLSVTGCDLQPNRQTEWLERCGIRIYSGHAEEHVTPDTDWVVRSTAVADSHPEVMRARALGKPVLRRGEVLPALMRDRICIAVSGTHGKTTTTAMIAQVLDCGYCIGGEIAGLDGVANDAPLMVVEADESDGTVAGYTPDYAVITNIEYDHMEHHASAEAFVSCFETLIHQTQEKVFYCDEDPVSKEVVEASLSASQKCEPFHYPEDKISIPLPGDHNQWNAAAALAVCSLWKSNEEILAALASMKPVRRRFETIYNERGIRIVSDYAHHPTEIAALVQSAQELNPRRLLAVFQPHRYTRTLALGPDFPSGFEGVDRLWLVPVYAASEKPLKGGTTEDLFTHFSARWQGRLYYSAALESAWTEIKPELQAGDLLLIVGAGDIEQLAEWARDLF